MRFTDEKARLTHPQARLIPKKLWDEVYQGEITETDIECMTSPFKNLEHVPALQEPQNKHRNFISILVSHGNIAPPNELIAFARTNLQLTNKDIFILATRCGNRGVMNQIIEEDVNAVNKVIRHDPYHVFHECLFEDNYTTINFLLKRLDYQVINSVFEANNFASFQELVNLKKFDTAHFLLRISTVYGFASRNYQTPNYEKIVKTATLDYLQKLSALKDSKEIDDNNALYGYHVLLHLIKVMKSSNNIYGDGIFQMIIDLFNIPSIKTLLMKQLPIPIQTIYSLLLKGSIPAEAIIKFGLELLDLNNNEIFIAAATNGCVDVINHLINLLSDNQVKIQAMIKAHDKNGIYVAFRLAAQYGHLPIINRLIELLDNNQEEIQAMVTSNNYSAFLLAAQNGHLDVINRLVQVLSNDPIKIQEMIKKNNYAAFELAAENGHLHIINRLVQLTNNNAEEIQAMIIGTKHSAVRLAAINGHFNIINRFIKLLAHNQEKIQAMITFNQYFVFQRAVICGHLPTINRFIELWGNNQQKIQEIIMANNYQAFQSAAENGHLPVIDRFIELLDKDPVKIEAMIQANNYSIFRLAAQNGHLLVIDRLISFLNNDPIKIQKMIGTSNYIAFRTAAKNGHLHVIDGLAQLVNNDPTKIQEMLQAKDINGSYAAFRFAAQNSHFDIINRFINLLGDNQEKIQEMITVNNYQAFQLAAMYGHLSDINRLIELINNDPVKIQEMLKIGDYAIFRLAAEYGHLSVINRLIELVNNDPVKIQEMIQAKDKNSSYAAFRLAAQNGHLHVIDRLFQLVNNDPTKIQEMIEASKYGAAAKNGQFHVIKRLAQLLNDNDKIQEIVSVNQCADFTNSIQKNHSDGINYLITFSSIYNHAATHYQDQGYSVVVKEATKKFMGNLLERKRTFSNITNQTGVFDLLRDDGSMDAESALYGYYVLRHFIEVSQSPQHNPYGSEVYQKIEELLDIPSIKNLVIANANGTTLPTAYSNANRTFAPRSNDLLRLTQSVRNERLFLRLLTIEAVRLAAENASYYEEHNLTEMAQNQESSMTALTPEEQERLAAVENHYAVIVKDKGGNQAVLEELRAYLKTAFLSKKHQSQRTIELRGKKYLLPFSKKNLDTFINEHDFSEEEIETINRVYFQNIYHSAHRWILKPNPWMDPSASYVCSNDSRTELWSTFEEYVGMIAYLWLAASDDSEAMKPTVKNMTVEDRINLFIKELSLIARAHNWDKTRDKIGPDEKIVKDSDGKVVKEEYDDLKKDRPTCFSGVKRRLFQSLPLGHPLYVLISAAIIKQFVNNFIRDHYQALLRTKSLDDLKQIKEDFNEYLIMLDLTPLLEALKPTSEEFSQSVFEAVKNQFGTHANPFTQTVNDILDGPEKNLFLACYKSADLGKLLDTVIRHKNILYKVTQKHAFAYLEQHPQETREVREKGITHIWNNIEDAVRKEIFEALKNDFSDVRDPEFKVLHEFIEQAKHLPYVPQDVLKAPVSAAARFQSAQAGSSESELNPASNNCSGTHKRKRGQ